MVSFPVSGKRQEGMETLIPKFNTNLENIVSMKVVAGFQILQLSCYCLSNRTGM